jgi:hypothetical protein
LTRAPIRLDHKVHIYLVRIGTPHPLSCKLLRHLPEPKWEGRQSPAGEWGGGSQFGRLEQTPSNLSTLWLDCCDFSDTYDCIQMLCPFVISFRRHLVLNLFPFPLTPAKSIVVGLPIRVGAAKCLPHLSFFKFFYVCSTIILADRPTIYYYYQITSKVICSCEKIRQRLKPVHNKHYIMAHYCYCRIP